VRQVRFVNFGLGFPLLRSLTLILIIASALIAGLAAPARISAQTPAEPQGEVIGTIEGNAIALKGPMSVQVVGNEVKTLLRSGVDVRVKTGTAKIELAGGGTISICGPAHISMLKANNGLTLALDSGTVHAHIEGNLTLSVFTAQILAKTIAISGQPQDILVGFDTPGLMCVRATRGAVRLEEQFGSQSVVVPQGSDVTLTNGQLEGMRQNNALCACEASTALQLQASNAPEVSTPATTEEVKRALNNPKNPNAPKPVPAAPAIDPPKPAAAAEGPTYQVYMPPLRYDASQTVQDEPDPKLIVLVRRIRVRPTLIFESRVEGDPAAPASKTLAATAVKPPAPPAKPATPNTGLVDRVKSFIKSLWTPNS
jgi:hypothetical protein